MKMQVVLSGVAASLLVLGGGCTRDTTNVAMERTRELGPPDVVMLVRGVT